MDELPKTDRFFLWLFKGKPGDSSWKANGRVAIAIFLGVLAVVMAYQCVRWVALD